MGAVQILTLLLGCAVAFVLLLLGFSALRRDLHNGRRWKQAEPEVCRAVEQVTGQPVRHQMMLNASMTEEFSPRTVFWLWLAVTNDYIVLVQRDWEDDGSDSAPQRLGRRREATLRRAGKRFAELTIRDDGGGEALTVWLCPTRRQYEELSRLVPTTRPR